MNYIRANVQKISWRGNYIYLLKQSSNYSQNADFTNSCRLILTDFLVIPLLSTFCAFAWFFFMDYLYLYDWRNLINFPVTILLCVYIGILIHSIKWAFLMDAVRYADRQLTCMYSGTLKSLHLHAHIFIQVRCNEFLYHACHMPLHGSICMILIFMSPNHSSHFNIKFNSRRRSFLQEILQIYLADTQ